MMRREGRETWNNLHRDQAHARRYGRLYLFNVFWYRLHYAAIRKRLLFTWFGALWTVVFFLTLRRIRGAIARNLEVVMGPASWWESQRRIFMTMWHWTWCRTERYEQLQPEGDRPEVCIQVDGGETWEALSNGEPGFVAIGSHVGNFESAFILPHDMFKKRLHTVRAPEPDAKSEAFVRELVESACDDNLIIHFLGQDDETLGVTLLDALNKGEIVALACDRSIGSTNIGEVRLFGRKAYLPLGPVALARLADVPLLPIFLYSEGRRRCRLVTRPPIRVPRTADREADLAAALQEVANNLEWGIKQEPLQWFCFKDMWGELSEGEGLELPGNGRARAEAWTEDDGVAEEASGR